MQVTINITLTVEAADLLTGQQATQLEAAKAAQLEAIRQQATAGMALDVEFA